MTTSERNMCFHPQAPSAYLCVAILSLHSDQTACGHELINHCRSLSRKLTNPEVDACLLSDIMQQLLFSAKLMFVKVGRNQDLALCDRWDSTTSQQLVLMYLWKIHYKFVGSCLFNHFTSLVEFNPQENSSVLTNETHPYVTSMCHWLLSLHWVSVPLFIFSVSTVT